MWGLCDPPLVHGNVVIKSAWVLKKEALKPTSWWERVQTGTKTHREPGSHGEETSPWARGYKKIIKNSHVNNIIITRVTVIRLKKYRRKWYEQHRWRRGVKISTRWGNSYSLVFCVWSHDRQGSTGATVQVLLRVSSPLYQTLSNWHICP